MSGQAHSQAGQQAAIDWAAAKYLQECGKSVTPAQKRRLHDEITKQGLTRGEILELMKTLFGCSAGGQ